MNYSDKEAIADIPGAPYDVLKARFVVLAGVIDVVSAERKALADEIAARENEASIRIRLGALKPDEKDMYQAVIEASK